LGSKCHRQWRASAARRPPSDLEPPLRRHGREPEVAPRLGCGLPALLAGGALGAATQDGRASLHGRRGGAVRQASAPQPEDPDRGTAGDPYDHECGLWEEIGPALYEIHDFADFNPPLDGTGAAPSEQPAERNGTYSPVARNTMKRSVPFLLSLPVTRKKRKRNGPHAHAGALGTPIHSQTHSSSYVGTLPQPPSPDPGWALDEFARYLRVHGEATGVEWREDGPSRTAWFEKRRAGWSCEDIEAASQGCLRDDWIMGRTGTASPTTTRPRCFGVRGSKRSSGSAGRDHRSSPGRGPAAPHSC